MNPYSHVTVAGDPRTWHTPIVADAVQRALAAGIPLDRIGDMLKGSGSELQLTLETAIHAGGPREERMSRLWTPRRHRYHDDTGTTALRMRETGHAIARWAFNERRATALAGASCDLPENRWAIHVPLVARRYREWRALDDAAFLYCLNDEETFKAQSGSDRLTSFACTIGDARIDATWKSTVVDVPISVPHTLDAALVGKPVSHAVQHAVLDDPALVISEIRRVDGRTRFVLERAWTTLGNAP